MPPCTCLFGAPATLGELPVRRDVTGIGLSDDLSYARPLATKLGYRNTWFHTELRLDIADIPTALEGRYDFMLASDVFEHGRWRLFDTTADGRAQVFDRLVFHGGPGTTLETRLFSRAALEREFALAGFASVRVAAEPNLPFGIVWPRPWSVPMVARA